MTCPVSPLRIYRFHDRCFFLDPPSGNVISLDAVDDGLIAFLPMESFGRVLSIYLKNSLKFV